MVILTNYGPLDNFKKDTSHVIAALIRRFHEAMINNEQRIWFGAMEIQLEFLLHK